MRVRLCPLIGVYMSDLPECLQPAAQQLEKYEVQIAALENKNSRLDEDISALKNDKESLEKKIEEELEASINAAENFETEKLTLRELNVVVSDQLREKIEELNALSGTQTELEAENGHFKNLNTELSEQKSKADLQQLHASISQEAISQRSDKVNEELEELRIQNKALKDENSALTLVNSAMHQRQLHAVEEQSGGSSDNSALVAEIERLTQELHTFRNDTSDEGFLRSENERLVQRHGEITQEKMQMSGKMHAAQNELGGVTSKLDAAVKNIEQLEFDLQGLQNLHKNLTDERNSLLEDNGELVVKNSELEEKAQQLGAIIQRITTEKEMVVQELNNEHIKADAMTEEVNHLRMKSRTLAEDIKSLKEGVEKVSDDVFEPQVEALEIDMSTTSESNDLDIDIVESQSSSTPHFPGESTEATNK